MIETVGVVGGGTMGHGIAGSFALAQCDVVIFEPFEQARDRILPALRSSFALLVEEDVVGAEAAEVALNRVRLAGSLEEAARGRAFVVEAIPENIDLKRELFANLDRLSPRDAVFASNTSSLPLAELTRDLPPERRARTLVTHWYNPPLLMPIVELSFFGNMSEAIYAEVDALHRRAGKETVKVLKDAPGLVANRIQQAVAREVFSIIEEGIAAPEDVDRALKFGPAFRYATTGQLEVADLGGLDIWLTVGDNLLPVMDASRTANRRLRELVAAGKLGAKSGEGFYRWDPDTLATKQRAFQMRLSRQLKAAKAYV